MEKGKGVVRGEKGGEGRVEEEGSEKGTDKIIDFKPCIMILYIYCLVQV